jgi:DNA-directed RNA polymerase specialized sigma24 family protein
MEPGNVTDSPKMLAERFKENRARLRSIAYRMLGSTSEAEDAVQESWMRLSRADTDEVENLRACALTCFGRASRGARPHSTFT